MEKSSVLLHCYSLKETKFHNYGSNIANWEMNRLCCHVWAFFVFKQTISSLEDEKRKRETEHWNSKIYYPKDKIFF